MTEPIHPPSRRSRAGLVLLALVFLAVIGGALGFVFGRAARHSEQAANNGTGATGPIGEPTGTPSVTSGGTHCPSASERAAGRPLLQVFYLQTVKSQVWICRDPNGLLYYQGLTATDGLFTDRNSILLSNAAVAGEDRYVAVNYAYDGTWKYTVSPVGLVIQRDGGIPTIERPAPHSPG